MRWCGSSAGVGCGALGQGLSDVVRRAATALSLVALGAACSDGDLTTLTPPDRGGGEPAPDEVGGESRTFAILSERESLDTLCRFAGVLGVGRAGAGGSAAAERAACAARVENCRTNVEALLGARGEAPPLGLPAADLEPAFGCPLTLAELDGCLAGALERTVASYAGGFGCDMPSLPELDPIRLLASPECLVVALKCPALVAGAAGRSGPTNLR